MSRFSTRLSLAAALLVGTVSVAQAHAHLKGAMPAADSTVAAAPTELALTFSEGVNLAFTGVTMTGPGAAPAATGPARFGPGGDTSVVVPVTVPLGAGTYRIDWHALATDGHKTTGSYSFTVRP